MPTLRCGCIRVASVRNRASAYIERSYKHVNTVGGSTTKDCDIFVSCCAATGQNGNGSDHTNNSKVPEPSQSPALTAASGMSSTVAERSEISASLSSLTVKDIMVSPALSLGPETEATEAMTFLVENGISGVPVTDNNGKVLGVVSGYDLLALDCTPGKLDRSFFPPIDTCINEFEGDRKMMWSNFNQLRRKLKAADGTTVQEAMHKANFIGEDASLEDAANVVVQKRAHRICVADADGKLIGVVSRGDIMRATIARFKAYMAGKDAND